MKKIPLIDLVRSFSILAVLAHHLGLARITAGSSWSPLAILWFKIWANGHFGVTLFFVISGFLITGVIASGPRGLFNPSYGDFYARRAGRIFPLLTFICLLGLLLDHLFTGASSASDFCLRLPQGPQMPLFWLSIVTFTENLFKIFSGPQGYPHSLYWGVLWSLAIEEQFYLFYPWVLKRLKNRRRMTVFMLTMILVGILSMVIASLFWHKYPIVVFNPATPYNSFAGFGLIAIGCLLYLAVEKFRGHLASHTRLCWVLSLAGLGLIAVIYWHVTVSIDFWWMALGDTLVATGLFMFLLGAMGWKGWHSPLWRPFSWPGRFSYGGYLYHSAVLFFLWPLLSGMNAYGAFGVFALAVTLISGISFYALEKPANSFIRKTLGSSTPV